MVVREASPNPLREPGEAARVAGAAAIVIFGATGDLARRKLVPALYHLAVEGHLPAEVSIIGVARREQDENAFRSALREGVEKYGRTRGVLDSIWSPLAGRASYLQATFDESTGYRALEDRLNEFDRSLGRRAARVFYLATPPDAYRGIIGRLAEAGLSERGRDETRIVVEKPFGHDRASAADLNALLHRSFDEGQIFRIDHYLGKETVQNLLVLRFANSILEPLWNRHHVDHVQITAAEEVGVGGRGAYYERTGALRDMVQSHLLQLLSLVAMEPPVALDADAIRDEKVKVLRAIAPCPADGSPPRAVRGQYGAGAVAGESVAGYGGEESVDPDSRTETFAALRLDVNNWRWSGVPFYLRTGKRLAKRITEIAVVFREPLGSRFREELTGDPNVLSVQVQPDEGVALKLGSKVPGTAARIRPVTMDFRYGAAFGMPSPDAYERLLLDVLTGDSTLFARSDEVDAAWRIIDPLITAWQESGDALEPYPAGSWGPDSAGELAARDGRAWRRL